MDVAGWDALFHGKSIYKELMSCPTPWPQHQGGPATSPKLAPGPSLGTTQMKEDVV
jgi:hypothetical protein